MAAGLLPRRPGGVTANLPLVGAPVSGTQPLSAPPGLHLYGSEADAVSALPGADREIAPQLSEAMVRFAARAEYARSVEDVLARRSRLLFLDADAALAAAPRVAALLAEELGASFDGARSLQAFAALAGRYRGATLQ
jgi:glycerol-3-phosphate dehydrogenase